MQKQFKIVIEKHTDGYVAYPVGLKGVVGEGDTYEEALTDIKSAIRFHIETFGQDVLQNDDSILEAFVAETEVAVSGPVLAKRLSFTQNFPVINLSLPCDSIIPARIPA
jgi:predicted RNase H-like HicB family nuclease